MGTIKYPFKDLNLVFLELFNHHQHTDRVVNVFVYEATDSYLLYDFAKIVNITQVNIDTYTTSLLNEPKNVNFRLVDDMYDMHTKTSLFNVIQNLNKSEIDVSNMEEHEIGDLTEQSFVIFIVHRSSVRFNHIDVHSHFSNAATSVWLIYTSY